MSGARPGELSVSFSPTSDPAAIAYPLRMQIGWPLRGQRIRVRDHRSDTVFRMLVHLARPARCEVSRGADDGEPDYVIEAERFYSQSRTYQILDRGGAMAGWLEYQASLSIFETDFRFYRRDDSIPAFYVNQKVIGPKWLDRLVGRAASEIAAYPFSRPNYVVSAADGAPIMWMRFSYFSARRICDVDRMAPSLDRSDEVLCLLGLSVVAICEFARRRDDATT